jgi:hypothetical protein
MNAYGPTFRLPAVVRSFGFDMDAWSRSADAWAVTHKPSHCMFAIDLPRQRDDETMIDPFSFGARLIHVCDGHEPPTREEQRALAHEALKFWAVAFGLREAPVSNPAEYVEDPDGGGPLLDDDS